MNNKSLGKTCCTLAVAVLIISGCTMVPHYERPDAPVASSWPVEKPAEGANLKSVTETGWRDFFVAPELQGLIQRGLENNRDLRQAALNIEAVRAEYRIQRSNLFPSVAAGGGMTKQRVPETVSATGDAYTSTQYDATVSTAFELDLFGRLRSLNEAALEDYFATEEARNAAQISLVSGIATSYLTLLADQEQLELSQQTLESQQKSYDLALRKFESGIGTKLELRQVETLLETARVDQSVYARRIAQDRNALELLVGGSLQADSITGAFRDADGFVSNIDGGLPSDLLQNRPDIRQAEHALKSANANIGAARAAFFPTISLTASGGTAGSSLSDLFSGGSGTWSFIPNVSVPIFTAGRNKATLDVSNLRKEISVAQYEKSIQSAFREVSDALVARKTLDSELVAQKRLVAATDDAFKISQARYERGIDSYLTVLDSRRSLYAAQQQQIATRLAMLSNFVNLYASLGGGQDKTSPKADAK